MAWLVGIVLGAFIGTWFVPRYIAFTDKRGWGDFRSGVVLVALWLGVFAALLGTLLLTGVAVITTRHA